MILGTKVTEEFYDKICQKIADDYNEEKKDLPPKLRGCNHPVNGDNPFCGQCGKPSWKDNSAMVLLTAQDIDEHCVAEYYDIYPFDWEWDCSECCYYVGKDVRNLDKRKTIVQTQLEISKNIKEIFNHDISVEQIDFEEMSTDH